MDISGFVVAVIAVVAAAIFALVTVRRPRSARRVSGRRPANDAAVIAGVATMGAAATMVDDDGPGDGTPGDGASGGDSAGGGWSDGGGGWGGGDGGGGDGGGGA
jgi:hypothetical protein